MPRTRPLPLLLAIVLLAAGCAAPAVPAPPADTPQGAELPSQAPVEAPRALEAKAAAREPPQPRILMDGRHAIGTKPMQFSGQASEPPAGLDPCAGSACVVRAFTLQLPAGHWEAEPGSLEVSVSWPSTGHERFELRVTGPSGELVGEARLPEDTLLFEAKFGKIPVTSHALLLESAPAGEYHVEVRAVRGAGPFTGVVQVEPARPATPAVDLLPDLVPLAPSGLRIEAPQREPLSGAALGAAGIHGCGADEVAEDRARRCLRFDLGAANVGTGPLEARLRATDLGGEARFRQRVHAADGSWRESAVGRAELHATHGHIHYESLASFALHAYDEKRGVLGEAVREGRKLGFCVADLGLVDLGLPGTVGRAYFGEGCFTPDGDGDYWMGISAGWTDVYWWQLPDQYIEVTGIADGTYALVATANPDGTLIEADGTNNASFTAFRLEGDVLHLL
jgi:hypothetical protein